jgi:ubiquinone/menaquinone biosynthesis C-methylase UbiE
MCAAVQFDDEDSSLVDAFTAADFERAVQANFDARAPEYTSGASGEMHKRLIEKLVACFPPVLPLLDVACGPGVLCELASPLGRDTTGLDLAPAMVDAARRRCPRGVFQQGTALAMPFIDSEFASLYICSAFVYFTDTKQALSEARRVLRKDGFVALEVLKAGSYVLTTAIEVACADALGKERGGRVFTSPHVVTASEDVMRSLLRDAGFVDFECVEQEETKLLNVDDAEKFWPLAASENVKYCFSPRLRTLTTDDLQRVRERFIRYVEERRDAEGYLRDSIVHLYCRAYKR